MNRIPAALLVLAALCGACSRSQDTTPATTADAAKAAPAAPVESPIAAPPAPKLEKQVALQVKAETWRTHESPFDIAPLITESLRRAGVAVVPDSAPARDALLLVEYAETEGSSYTNSLLGTGPSIGKGTNTSSEITLLSPQGEVLLRLRATAGTPASISGEMELYTAAIAALRKSVALDRLGRMVRAALGSSEAFNALLPDALDDEISPVLKGLVERLHYEPSGDVNRAWLALANDDFAALRAIGRPALEPLLAHLGKWGWPKERAKSAAALADLGDPRAAGPVAEAAVAAANNLPSSDDVPHVLTLLDAAGRIGDAFAIAKLQDIANSRDGDFAPPPEIREAAAKAVAAIRARMTEKSKSD